jgi:hypothetical protein
VFFFSATVQLRGYNIEYLYFTLEKTKGEQTLYEASNRQHF